MAEIRSSQTTAGAAHVVVALPAGDGGYAVEATLLSDAEGVMLTLGPSARAGAWPDWARGRAIYGETGATLRLRLDAGAGEANTRCATRALGLVGRNERLGLAAALAGLPDQLAGLPHAAEPMLDQAVQVTRGLLALLPRAPHIPSPRPAAQPELFTPSDLPVELDDLYEAAEWSHLRLTYRLPRIGGRWAEACSWRLFRRGDAFGIELRALIGDYLPDCLRPFCAEDDLGPLLRFEAACSAAGQRRCEPAALDPAARRLLAALARQTAWDLAAPSATDTPPRPFAAERWRHWLVTLPDLIATAT